MKVSVVVPAYNEENYLGNCLDALMKQEEKPDEIIVVNNNSTDKTVDIAKKYDVRVVNETEQGMIQARNRGFNEAQHEIIARTDADTMVPSDWIKKIKQHFINNDVVAVSGEATTYDLSNELARQAAIQSQKSYFILMRTALGHDCLLGPNMAIRKSAWEKVKNTVCLNDNDVHEDIDLAIHIASVGEIKHDKTLIVNSSFRRFKKITSYFEYPYRTVKSVNIHKQRVMKEKSKAFVKKFVAKAFLNN